MPEHTDDPIVRVDYLKLAAWLRLNDQKLVNRELLSDGRVAYYFLKTGESDHLVRRWWAREEEQTRLSRFASIVSFEIRAAIKLKRAHGMPKRLSGVR